MKFFSILIVLLSLLASASAIFFKGKFHPPSIVIQANAVKSPEIPDQQQQIVQTVNGPTQMVKHVDEVHVPVISTKHNVHIVPVTVEAPGPFQQTQVVSVEPNTQSIHLIFKSVSSPLSIQQHHQSSEGTYHETIRTEEPLHVVRQEIFKPVIQELRETIQPYRQVTQEIKPVLEKVNLLLPRKQINIEQGRFLPFPSVKNIFAKPPPPPPIPIQQYPVQQSYNEPQMEEQNEEK